MFEVGDRIKHKDRTGKVAGIRGPNATYGKNQVFVKWDDAGYHENTWVAMAEVEKIEETK